VPSPAQLVQFWLVPVITPPDKPWSWFGGMLEPGLLPSKGKTTLVSCLVWWG